MNSDPAKVYLFSGEEEYEKQRALACLRRRVLGEGEALLNDTVLEGADAQTVCETCAQFPMFADRRIVTVRDYPPLLIASPKGGEKETDRMLSYLDDPCDTCVLVFYVHGELPGRAFPSKVKEHPNVVHVEFALLSDKNDRQETEARLQEFLKPYGKEFTRDGADMMIRMCGTDLGVLSNEAEKLAAYTGDRQKVTARDVERCASPAAAFRVYTIMQMLADGDGAGAFRGLADALRSGEKHLALLALLERQLSNMAQIVSARDEGENKAATMARLNIGGYQYDVMAAQAGRLKKGAPEKLFLKATQAEYMVKSGSARQDAALEGLMLDVLAMRKA